jgi:hypothetical protein
MSGIGAAVVTTGFTGVVHAVNEGRLPAEPDAAIARSAAEERWIVVAW